MNEAGVKSIDLRYVETNIEVNGNLITDASHYTDSEGNLELAADIELALDQNSILLPIGVSAHNILVDTFEKTTQGYRFKQLIQKKQKEILMANYKEFPTVSVYGNYYMYGDDPSESSQAFHTTNQNSWKLGFSVRLRLFEGFKYRYENERLHHELKRLEEEQFLKKREYEYEVKSKSMKLVDLQYLEKQTEELYTKSSQKMQLATRLKEQREMNSYQALLIKLEQLEKDLDLQLERSDTAYEQASLDILYRGVEQCTDY